MLHIGFDVVVPVLSQLPNPAPAPPPGADKITEVAGYFKWGSQIALLVGFFAGLAVWAGGRWVDHHRAGKVGVVMMLCGVSGGLLYAVGYPLINELAGGGR
ncbi:hypothetical protein [Saccharopolyspora sp. 6V]|uniref:hypothetical protein n=1 Tax=Saccharopolyspora sp. 6V TaxID=2877239 RepID=UPI001CD2A1BF|nr:hypothetical protein [Saccharopolyspora sp. 6V]MCA1196171.1 hypothetical protein [Saccharopolyspora sp. 6V]